MDFVKLIEIIKDKKNIEAIATEEAKKKLLIYLNDNILPAARQIADEYIAKLNDQSKTESGWLMFRDSVFIPTVIKIGLYLFEHSTRIMIEKTK